MRAKKICESFTRGQDPKKIIGVGVLTKPMKERPKEYNISDMQKAIDYLKSSGIVELAPMTKIQENHLTLKLQLKTPYWYKRVIKSKTSYIDVKSFGTVYYFIQNGYLRKLLPNGDRNQVIIRDDYATYLELAKILVDKAKKDMIKSEMVEKSNLLFSNDGLSVSGMELRYRKYY